MATVKKTAKKAAPKKAAAKKTAVRTIAPKKAAAKKAPPKPPARVAGTTRGGSGLTRGDVMVATTVTVHAKFDNVSAGASDFTATHNGENPKRLRQSGNVSFDDVKKGDTIEISSDSPGDTAITVSGANTNPVKMTAKPGEHIGDFFLVV